MPGVDGFQWLTAGIAVLGLVLAVASLVWQIITWRLTGSVVKIDLAYAFTVGGTMESTACFSITARNLGRLAVAIDSWGLKLPPEGATMVTPNPRPWQGPPVPVTLEAGHSVTWYMVRDEIIGELRAHFAPGVQVRGMVRTGTGEMIVSKRAIAVE
jgi:hypothetical protein